MSATENLQAKEKKASRSIPKLILAVLACEAVGGIGSIFTIGSVSTWYASIQKPWFTPPNWLFGPVWITLFFLMGVSLYLLWIKHDQGRATRTAFIAFGAQLSLNVLWTYLFFGQRLYFAGFVEILVLWAAIAFTIFASFRVSKAAGLILVPYIAWVTIATLLNFYVWILNP